jgi:hypothetical protein
MISEHIEFFLFLVKGNVLPIVRRDLERIIAEQGEIPSIEALFFEYLPKIDYTFVELEGDYWRERLLSEDVPFVCGRELVYISTDPSNMDNQMGAALLGQEPGSISTRGYSPGL